MHNQWPLCENLNKILKDVLKFLGKQVTCFIIKGSDLSLTGDLEEGGKSSENDQLRGHFKSFFLCVFIFSFFLLLVSPEQTVKLVR